MQTHKIDFIQCYAVFKYSRILFSIYSNISRGQLLFYQVTSDLCLHWSSLWVSE